jgi:hypothetical protein
LAGDIDVAASKYVLKNNSLILNLIKKENKTWSQIAFK